MKNHDIKAPSLSELLPVFIFSALVIWIVRMHPYVRPMEQFFWTGIAKDTVLTDYYSYNKMRLIVVCAAAAFLMMVAGMARRQIGIARDRIHIPMAVYSLFVLISFALSDYKVFAWLGWNERFEGTLVLLCYMVMLFYTANTVRSEKQVRAILACIACSAALLGLLGLAQSLGCDFFQTVTGQKLMTPNVLVESGETTWQLIDAAAERGETALIFKFKKNQIYQTVYNSNYVSFYLTLLVPLCGMLFIHEWEGKGTRKNLMKLAIAALFGLLVWNMIGTKSSGGLLGVFVSCLTALALYGKTIFRWKKPLAALLIIAAAVMGAGVSLWLPGIGKSIDTLQGDLSQPAGSVQRLFGEYIFAEDESADVFDRPPGTYKSTVDYIVTGKDTIEMSLNGEPLLIEVDLNSSGGIKRLTMTDSQGNELPVKSMRNNSMIAIQDVRFWDYATISFSKSESGYVVVVRMPRFEWPFLIGQDGIYYINDMKIGVALDKVPHWGFENNLRFASHRGYIWSRTFPMLKDTLIAGHGADTFPIFFPQNDYAGKYTAGYRKDIYIDKPHNMYLGAAVGTGGISLLALLALYGMYLGQSFRLYRKKERSDTFLYFAGSGIFLGITGFLVAGLVNDSTVSVMPLFYTLLGTGIAVNRLHRATEGAAAKK